MKCGASPRCARNANGRKLIALLHGRLLQFHPNCCCVPTFGNGTLDERQRFALYVTLILGSMSGYTGDHVLYQARIYKTAQCFLGEA